MKKLFDALFGLSRAGVNVYLIARARFFALVAFGYLLIYFEWMMRYYGHMVVDVIISQILFFAAWFVLTRPEILALAETFELERAARIAKGKVVKPKIQDDNYFLLYTGYVLQWICIVSVFVTTIPFGWYLSFGESFLVTFTAMMFISVIAWGAFYKWTTVVRYKRYILFYATSGLLICVWMIIPGSIKYNIAGSESYGALGTSERAKEFSKANRGIIVATDKANAEEIRRIGKELAKCQGREKCLASINKDDLVLWNETRNELEKESLPSRIIAKVSAFSWPKMDFGGKAEANYVPPAAAPVPAPAINTANELPQKTAVQEIAGIWQFDWRGKTPTEFLITQKGKMFSGISEYADGSRMLLDIDRTGPDTFHGKWEIIGLPQKLSGSFDVTIEGSTGSGKWYHNAGNSTTLTISRS